MVCKQMGTPILSVAGMQGRDMVTCLMWDSGRGRVNKHTCLSLADAR